MGIPFFLIFRTFTRSKKVLQIIVSQFDRKAANIRKQKIRYRSVCILNTVYFVLIISTLLTYFDVYSCINLKTLYMNRLFFAGALAAAVILFSCTSNEIGNSKDVNPDAVYFDYQVNGSEGDNYVTVKLQYRFGGPNGTTLVLQEPSMVKLDGDTLKVDSSRMLGAYYEDQHVAKYFAGQHTIEFTDLNKKVYTESFNWEPIAITGKFPLKMKKEDLLISLSGTHPGDRIRVVVNDTSSASEGINRVDTLQNGSILISKADLAPLVSGPLRVELYQEQDEPLKHSTPEGGRLSLSYVVRRQIDLKN